MKQIAWFAAMALAASLAASAARGQAADERIAGGPVDRPMTIGGAPPRSERRPARKAHRHAERSGVLVDRASGERAALPDVPPSKAAPTRRAAAAPADDPISLGFKWQGSNDTAEKTRVQNYNGDASGTGAAVGLKLHF